MRDASHFCQYVAQTGLPKERDALRARAHASTLWPAFLNRSGTSTQAATVERISEIDAEPPRLLYNYGIQHAECNVNPTISGRHRIFPWICSTNISIEHPQTERSTQIYSRRKLDPLPLSATMLCKLITSS